MLLHLVCVVLVTSGLFHVADSCSDGWYGQHCKKKNVALRGEASQKSTYNGFKKSYTADLAVDGDTNTNFDWLSCSLTDKRNIPWWRVRLGQNGVNQIRYMKIFNRKEGLATRGRHKGMEILVDGRRCKKWPDNSAPPEIYDVTCDSTLTGNEVTIRVGGDSLSLCEVQVFVCSDFWFGEDCDKQCRCQDSSEVCDKGTGRCEKGCQSGFTGEDCQECQDGRYGVNCSSRCGHCVDNGICDKVNGRCPGGCAVGWDNDRCDAGCPGSTYGLNCAAQCGHCLNDGICNKVDGGCPGGCARGWKGDKCDLIVPESELESGGVGKLQTTVICNIITLILSLIISWRC